MKKIRWVIVFLHPKPNPNPRQYIRQTEGKTIFGIDVECVGLKTLYSQVDVAWKTKEHVTV